MAEPRDGGSYTILTTLGSFALTGKDSKITLTSNTGEAASTQTWKFSKVGEDDDNRNLFRIVCSASEETLTLRYTGMLDDRVPVRLVKTTPQLQMAQKWYFESAGTVDGKAGFRIYSPLAMNLCLPDNAAEGAEIYTWIRDETEKSSFYLVEA